MNAASALLLLLAADFAVAADVVVYCNWLCFFLVLLLVYCCFVCSIYLFADTKQCLAIYHSI